MKFLRRFANTVCVMLMMNIVALCSLAGKGCQTLTGRYFTYFSLIAGILLLFLVTEILPCYEKGLKVRLQILIGGY
ncbi:MAG: hypothetical protein ACI4TB_04775, partial [Lachnospiraceae bacterium]